MLLVWEGQEVRSRFVVEWSLLILVAQLNQLVFENHIARRIMVAFIVTTPKTTTPVLDCNGSCFSQ